MTSFHDAVTAARADRAKGSTELAETLARWAQFCFFYFPRDPSHNALEGGVSSHVIHGLKLSGRRHCELALLTAYRMAQGPRQKGVRAPDRVVLDLDTLRVLSTFASGQHIFLRKTSAIHIELLFRKFIN